MCHLFLRMFWAGVCAYVQPGPFDCTQLEPLHINLWLLAHTVLVWTCSINTSDNCPLSHTDYWRGEWRGNTTISSGSGGKSPINFSHRQCYGWSYSMAWTAMKLCWLIHQFKRLTTVLEKYKAVYIQISKEKLTTTPKVNFGKNHSITELEILSCAQLTAGGS